MVLTK